MNYVQQMSKKLLGQGHRLEVAAAVFECPEDELYEEKVAEHSGLKEVRVGEQLRHLSEAGLLNKLPRDGRRQPYRRKDTVYWRLCKELRDELRQQGGSQTADEPDSG